MTAQGWQRVWEIYKAALTLPVERRPAFLQSAGANDEVAGQVLALLDDSNASPPPPSESYLAGESPIRPGSPIGRYQILGTLGRGGSGEAFAARDLELDRPVALKFLRQEDAAGAEHSTREAKAASALNHPNIVTVFEVIRSPYGAAIVMELVSGEELRSLCGAPQPVSRVLQIGEQLAQALAASHAANVVHRDIKPENIMVRADGYIKVLDFGLARRLDAVSISQGAPLTGTLRYMSPEQTLEQRATPASDVFAMGLVLFELAAGSHAYPANSALETMMAISRGEPKSLAEVNPKAPPELTSLIGCMLAKDPLARPTAAGVAAALAQLRENTSGSSFVQSGLRPRPRPWRAIASALASAVMLGGLILYVLWPFRSAAPGRVLDTRIDLGPGIDFNEEGFALSPDGRTLLLFASGRLRVLSLSGGPAREWAGVEDGRYPFWSPDGNEAGFQQNGTLWRRGFPDGRRGEICPAAGPVSASWSSRGTILFAADRGPVLYQVPAEGGTPVPVTTLEAGIEVKHSQPHFLPDGDRFLYFGRTYDGGRLLMGSLKNPAMKVKLGESQSGAVYLSHPDGKAGRLVFASQGQLVSQAFNPSDAVLYGSPSVVAPRVRDFRRGWIPASAAADGTLVYAEGEDKTDTAKVFDRDGRLQGKFGTPQEYVHAQPSADFSHFLLISRDTRLRSSAAQIVSRRTGASRPFTQADGPDDAIWSHDDKRVAFTSAKDKGPLFTRIASLEPNHSPEIVLPPMPYPGEPNDWSYDGRLLIVRQFGPVGRDLWIQPLDPAQTPRPLVASPGNQSQGRFAPGDKFVAYQSDESGATEVDVIPYPPDGRKWRVSVSGGQEPRWRADGKELFFLSLDYGLMTAAVHRSGNGLSFGKPQLLFGGRASEPSMMVWHAEPSADGREFLILTSAKHAPASPLRLRLHWWAQQPE